MGLGKLGLIMALVLDKHGKHDVTGYDPTDRPRDILTGKTSLPEKDFGLLLESNTVHLASSPSEVVRSSDVIFVVVATPHPPEYDGTVPSPEDPQDFEYGYLVQAVRDLAQAAWDQHKDITVVIVSTVLPGTISRVIWPLQNDQVTVVYSPSLIALGTVEEDLLNPDFVILGADEREDVYPVAEIYASLHERPLQIMSIESAELTKIAYNTFTSMKIVFANMLLETAEKTGADCDSVTGALAMSSGNLLSSRYLTGGMGGGGYCHPRDTVAMSYLARRLDLSTDLSGYLKQAREDQSGWLADTVEKWSKLCPELAVIIMGTAYKPGSPLTGGSAALLLRDQLKSRGIDVIPHDPYVNPGPHMASSERVAQTEAVFVIGCAHPEFRALKFAPSSVVIDPTGTISDRPGVTVVRLGRKNR